MSGITLHPKLEHLAAGDSVSAGDMATITGGTGLDLCRFGSDRLQEGERAKLLYDGNQTWTEYPRTACVHELFEAQAASRPEAPAVECAGKQLSYRELNLRADLLAFELQRAGVRPEVLVGLCLEPSLDLVVGVLGILKAGGAYVPLDPAYPKERLAFMLQDAALRVVVTQENVKAFLPANNVAAVCLPMPLSKEPERLHRKPVGGATSENLAYVIYTSGSTGRPKGVMVPHRGLVNYLSWAIPAYRVVEGTGAPVQSSIAFDLTVTSLFAPLLAGCCVQILPSDRGLCALSDSLRQTSGFSLLKITPAHLEMLQLQLSALEVAGRARTFVIGGEALLGGDLQFWQDHAPETVLVNEYGPTETAVGCCAYFVPKGKRFSGQVPIGRPIANTQVYVLDPAMQPVPTGAVGELYIGGDGVARGYWNLPELTARSFIADPFAGPDRTASGKLYKSGDLVRYLPDGNLEFLGRLDDQVKIRGHRIELGEIEIALASHPDVKGAVVRVEPDSAGYRSLTAYCVGRTQPAPCAVRLRQFLSTKLPSGMVPARFVMLDAFPLTCNGKVDRQALRLSEAKPVDDRQAAAPRTELEQTLLSLWQEVFQREGLGIHDDFFDLGGHSLLAVRLIVKINHALNSNLEVMALFQWPTVAELAIALPKEGQSPRKARLVCIHSADAEIPVIFLNPPSQVVRLARVLQEPRSILVSDLPFAREVLLAAALQDASRLPGVPEMAAPHVALIRNEGISGPCILAGFSSGGLLAFEAAHQLQRAGVPVPTVLLFDTERTLKAWERFPRRVIRHARNARREGLGYFWNKARTRWGRESLEPGPAPEAPQSSSPVITLQSSSAESIPGNIFGRIWHSATARYRWRPLPSRGVLFRAASTMYGPTQDYDGCLGWAGFFDGGLQVVEVPGDHFGMWKEPNLLALSRTCSVALRTVAAPR